MAFEFLPLTYDFAQLEPAMTEKTARWHHDIIHGSYVEAVNRLLKPYPDFSGCTIERVLSEPERIPAVVSDDVRFHGGGHANHQFMWKILGAKRGTRPAPTLGERLSYVRWLRCIYAGFQVRGIGPQWRRLDFSVACFAGCHGPRDHCYAR